MANNNILFNSAYAGFIQGCQSGRNPVSQTAADYNSLVLAAAAFATRVDSKIPNNALISQESGAALQPSTAAIAEDQLAYTALLQAICCGITTGRWYTSQTAAFYDDLADVCAAQFTQALTQDV